MASSEQELIEQAKAGNLAAFEQLVFRHDEEVLNIAARYTNNSDDAKDIYQETFIRVFKGLSGFHFKSEFSTWIYRIATNVCLTYINKTKRDGLVLLNHVRQDGIEDQLSVESSVTDSSIYGDEISRRIEKALQELSSQQRLVFTLRHFEEYKLKEIASMMNCAEGTVKKYLFEATRKMRMKLRDLYE